MGWMDVKATHDGVAIYRREIDRITMGKPVLVLLLLVVLSMLLITCLDSSRLIDCAYTCHQIFSSSSR